MIWILLYAITTILTFIFVRRVYFSEDSYNDVFICFGCSVIWPILFPFLLIFWIDDNFKPPKWL